MNSIFLDVPKIKQLPDNCGPTSLAMISEFYGKNYSQEDIAQLCSRKPVQGVGVLDSQLLKAARTIGFQASLRSSQSIGNLIQELEHKRPLMVTIRDSDNDLHWIVIKGYNAHKKQLYINDPYDLRKNKVDFSSLRWNVKIHPHSPMRYALYLKNKTHKL